jgi:hypothetical protein
MFFLFSNRPGCLGSIVVSVAAKAEKAGEVSVERTGKKVSRAADRAVE